MKTVLEKALFKFVSILDKLKIDYAVIGGIATGIYGLPRTTYDIDIIIFIEKVKIPIFLNTIEVNGFKFNHDRILEELNDGYLSEVWYQKIRIDILLPILPFFKQVIERGVVFELSGNNLKFATAEDLVILKLLSNRQRDKEDVETIKYIHSELDVSYIKDSLKKLVGKKHLSFVTFQKIFGEN